MTPFFDTRLSLLKADEEHQLALEYQRTHDRHLEDRLVRSQLRLVAKLARELARRPEDIEELVQEGALGLVKALRRFDANRGVRLSTYATWWIRAYQLRWLVANHRLVRLGTTAAQRRIFFNGRETRARRDAAGLDASTGALAREIGVRDRDLEETLQRIEQQEVSLDQPVRGAEQVKRSDRLVDESAPPDERAEEHEVELLVAREAARFRDSLKGRDRTLFDERWMNENPPTLKTMGDRLGVSRERARQLEERLLRRLREQLPADLAEAAA